MTTMRHLVLVVAIGAVSIFATFAFFVIGAPAENPGYAKAVALLWPVFSIAIFGGLWPIALAVVWAFTRKRPHVALIVTGALLIIFSAWFAAMAVEQPLRERLLLRRIARAPHDSAVISSFVDEYLQTTKNGTLPAGYREKPFRQLIRDPHTSAQVLNKIGLALADYSESWQFLALNPSIPRGVVEARMKGPPAIYFATNPRVPPDLLAELAKSSDWNVRIPIARNTNTPKATLEQLSHDEVSMVRDFARQNLAGTLGSFGYR